MDIDAFTGFSADISVKARRCGIPGCGLVHPAEVCTPGRSLADNRAQMTLYIAAAICAAGFAQTEAASGLYAPLLREHYHGRPASQMVVTDEAVAMPTLQRSLREWLKQFDEVPAELRRAASQPSPTEVHRLDASLFPPGTRLVSAVAVEKIFKGSATEDPWAAFKRQFRSEGWL